VQEILFQLTLDLSPGILLRNAITHQVRQPALALFCVRLRLSVAFIADRLE
jgi:hypothetical protein